MANAANDLAAHAMPATRARHLVLAFGLAITAITYLDRVCISMTAPFVPLFFVSPGQAPGLQLDATKSTSIEGLIQTG